jgi:hypothetical protein
MVLEKKGGDKPALWGSTGLSESFPYGKWRNCLGDVSHVRESELQLSDLGVEPTLTEAMARQVRFEKRLRVHLGAAFLTLDGFKVTPSQRYYFRFLL